MHLTYVKPFNHIMYTFLVILLQVSHHVCYTCRTSVMFQPLQVPANVIYSVCGVSQDACLYEFIPSHFYHVGYASRGAGGTSAVVISVVFLCFLNKLTGQRPNLLTAFALLHFALTVCLSYSNKMHGNVVCVWAAINIQKQYVFGVMTMGRLAFEDTGSVQDRV